MEAITPLLTTVSVTYTVADKSKSADISEDVSGDLLSLTYEDKDGGEADTLSISLKDPEGKWAGSWTPQRGDMVEVTLSTQDRGAVSTGKMIIDRLQTSGRPRVFTIDAVSIPMQNSIRRTLKTRAFTKMHLKDIAQQICTDNDLELFWDSAITDDENQLYDKADQERISDLEFLQRLCKDAGLSLKLSSERLIVYGQESYEAKEPVCVLVENASWITSWSFEAQQSERYKACTVRWRDMAQKSKKSASAGSGGSSNRFLKQSSSGGNRFLDKSSLSGGSKKKASVGKKAEYHEYTYEDPSVEDSGQIYSLKKRARSQAEAERLAKAKLRRLNLRQLTGSLEMVGNPLMAAGSVVALSGFGSFDGNFIITSATHSMGSEGYRTSVQVRRVNNDY